MPTDASGTPTSLGIPTYNVDVDAPSGLGFNAAMGQIDTLIAARVAKPSGIASGEVPVWNGTGWDRSTTTRIGATSLGSGTPDATKFLRGDSSWQPLSSNVVTLYDSGVLGGSAASIDSGAGGFSSTGYSKLLIELYGRGTAALLSGVATFALNNDSGANYTFISHYLINDASVRESGSASGTYIDPILGTFAAANAPAGYMTVVRIELWNPASSTGYKPYLYQTNSFLDNANFANNYDIHGGGIYKSNTAITRVAANAGSITAFAAGSRMIVRGMV